MSNMDSFLNGFVSSTIENYKARAVGDHKSANKHYKAADKAMCEIKQIPDWINAFTLLLDHDHIGVRIRAASILLPYETKRAERVLKKCRLYSGEDGFVAQMILNQWRSGGLKFPEFEDGKVIYK